ncbi:hypothetical protein [Virgibacillus sp. SK37]|uniref:hypothetical protein n=1 Tax=Virgibacillus sp. SK37 TaxID=403957 RepID=UPI0004D15008|nr:hypothetical protein [Virgibacillus sp. SK37]AIF45108.1 hypothetical protein X953_01610 [Virgibacillus sp. SK37]
MSKGLNNNWEQNERSSIWKKRKKPFLFVEVILALTAFILSIINLIHWNTDLPLISFLITLLVGVVFTLRGIESLLNKEKGYKIIVGCGVIICIIAIITFIIKHF